MAEFEGQCLCAAVARNLIVAAYASTPDAVFFLSLSSELVFTFRMGEAVKNVVVNDLVRF